MDLRPWIGALALWLCACPGSRPVERVPPTALAYPIAFPLRLIRDVPFVQVRIDDGPPEWFAVDTGAPRTIIATRIASRIHKRSDDTSFVVSGTTQGSFETSSFVFDGVRVGDVTLDGLAGIVADLAPIGEHVGIPLGGILGFSAFEDYVFTLDYPGHQGILDHGSLPAADQQTVFRVVMHAEHPSITLRIGGAETIFELDSGSGFFMEIAENLLPRVTLRAPPIVSGHAIGLTGVAPIRAGRLDADVTLGARVLDHPIVFFGDDPSLNTDSIARLGGPLLANFAVTFDQHAHTVRLARADRAPIASPPLRSTGLEVHKHDATWRIAGFVPDTPASKLGLEIGDIVISLDGKPADVLDAGDWATRNRAAEPLHLVVKRGDRKLDVEVPTVVLVQ